ncbi:MAG TPA: DUF4097 family beta strand repeat-containing protein [Ruminiclostridium sp.]|nr:DUF4097 family beta strand repeat-containing protein [Ruminiclostridium sp.]
MNKKTGIVFITIWTIIAVVLIGILVSGFFLRNKIFNAFSFEGTQTIYVDKSYTSSSIGEIDIKVASADVNFTQSTSDSIKVHISGYGDSKDLYTVKQDGDKLYIVQKNKYFVFPFSFGFRGQHIDIEVPESYNKDIMGDLASGDISFKGNYSLGNINLHKVSGDMEADSIKADKITIVSTSGDLNIANIEGEYKINSTSGDMEIKSLSGFGSINSVSGDITCNLAALNGDLDINSTSGDLDLGIDKSIGAKIDAKTVSGDINANFAMSYSGNNKHSAEASIGDAGNNTIKVSHISGDINFSQR